MLFNPFNIKNLTAKNRIVMPPMCMYKAADGIVNDWHAVHYGARAIGQVGTIIVEATAIEPRGRITMNDLGLWNNKHIDPFKKIVDFCKEQGAIVGVQLAHAGRKSQVKNEPIVAPSPLAFSDKFPIPHELKTSELTETIRRFTEAAYRARKAGFDFIEIHSAHGYLINQFLSRLTNLRGDIYGQERHLFLKEILSSIKQVLSHDMPVFLRVSGEEYHPNGNHPEDLAIMLNQVKDSFDILHVSSGGVFEKESYDFFPGYQLEFAAKLKELVGKPVISVGRFENPKIAEQALFEGKADMIAIGKGLLTDPYWPLHAAKALNFDLEWPVSYQRAKIL